ncbi:oligosaccharide flippase family protein [Herbaspirillum sp. alder98]|uniref:oligosaccharide flippase family protein n=1 Tax=Herbaspirillum sp. alder98 TaxID=2913096 RepID=UPI001CD8B352|nr:oligosaccharide flippase family protein [Herbaspirillum sp. alder98]MCA1324322.1 oligosaccharide flippase family protein [Herbaspirillum sp. alder98]
MRLQALIVFSSAVMQRLSVLVMTILAARIIGASELGKFAIIYATCVNLTGFIGDGLAATVNREVPLAGQRSVNAQYEMASMLMSFCVVLALVLSLLTAVFAPLLSQVISGNADLTSYVRISSVMTLCLLPNTVANALLNSFDKNLPAAIVASIGAVVSVSLGLAGAMRAGSFGMCLGFAVGMVLLSVAYAILLKRYFPGLNLGLPELRNYFRSGVFRAFTFPTMAAMALGGPVHWLCLSFLGSSAAGVREIAIFSALFQWYSILTFIPGALMNFTIPWLARAKVVGEAEFRQRALRIVLLMSGTVGVLLALVVLFEPYILALYGPDFARESGVLVLLAVCGFLAALIAVMNQISWAAGKTWSNLMAASTYGVAYIVSAFVFIRVLHFGASGLGWSILIASLIQGSLQARFSFTNKPRTIGDT